MIKIAECLGVEIGETFKVIDKGNVLPYAYRITEEKGIEVLDYDTNQWEDVYASKFKWLLTSDIKIISQWKPKKNERYYSPFIAVLPEDRYQDALWDDNNVIDRYRYQLGIVCKTKEEAIAMTNKMLAAVREEEK